MQESIGNSSPALTWRESSERSAGGASTLRSTSPDRVAEGRDSRGYVEDFQIVLFWGTDEKSPLHEREGIRET
jgi:hypothetical protein